MRPGTVTGRAAWLGPALSGVLLAAAAPPSPSPLVPFVALVPLAVFLTGLPAGRAGALAAVGGGFLAGVLQHAWGLRWLPTTLGAIAGPAVGWAAFLAVLAVLGSGTGACAAALHRLVARRPAVPIAVPIAAALPVAWTALEWTLAHLPLGLAFPWAPLGLGLARWPETLGLAEVAGVLGVTAWLAGVNGLLAATLLSLRDASPRPAAAAALGAILLASVPVAGGVVRARTLEAPSFGRIGALALAVAPGASAADRAAAGAVQTGRALARITPGEVDLLVLPEMLLPLDPRSAAGAPFVARLDAGAASLGAPLLVGVLGVEDGRAYNSALLIGAGGAFRADKRHLVPGVERASAVRAPWLTTGSSGYEPGRGAPVAHVGGLAVGALVCYDVAFAEQARALVHGGARALAALTSDAWFGTGGARDAGVAQQLAHLTLRVIETRTGAVRASNGGPAVALSPTGRIEAAADPGGGPTFVEGAARALTGRTVFVRLGDVVGPLAAALLLVLLAAGSGRARGRLAP